MYFLGASDIFPNMSDIPGRGLTACPGVQLYPGFPAGLLRLRNLILLLCNPITREKVRLNDSSCGPAVPDVAKRLFLAEVRDDKEPQMMG